MKHGIFSFFKALPLLGIFLSGTLNAQSQGIQFEHGNWQSILAKAKAENKLVFVDAYTTWCGPCKMLARNTFPDSLVGVFFNKHFVNAKMDMEKGEGIALAEQFSVNAYPTLIFTDANGQQVHRGVGYYQPAQLIALGEKALQPATQLASLQKRYASGDRQADFLLNYLNALSEAYDPQAGPVANQFLATQTDFSTATNMEIIARHADDPFAPAFQYLVNNRAPFDAKFGQANIDARIQGIFDQYLMLNPDLEWAKIETLIRATFPQEADQKVALFQMDWFRNREDAPNFMKAAVAYYDRFPSDNPDELNEIAWIFYKNTNDKKMLKKALKWAEQSVKLYESFYNTDTAAHLYAKLGQKKKAIQSAQRAIELAKKSGDDYSETQALLDELK